MAYDKVVDSAVLDAGLKQIADAIRAKTETTDGIDFADMAALIEGIEAGGAIYLGSITPSEQSTTVTITHNLNCPAKTISFIIFANDTLKPTTDVHSMLRWVRSVNQRNDVLVSISANYVTNWSTYGPHSSSPKITEISVNEMTVGNSNPSYGFGAGRTYVVVAWAWEELT